MNDILLYLIKFGYVIPVISSMILIVIVVIHVYKTDRDLTYRDLLIAISLGLVPGINIFVIITILNDYLEPILNRQIFKKGDK